MRCIDSSQPPPQRSRAPWGATVALVVSLPVLWTACGADDAQQQRDGGPVDAVVSVDRGPSYPDDPFAGLSEVSAGEGIYWGRSSFGDGLGQLLVWAPPSYSAAQSWPLVVFLHGGSASTDDVESQLTAYSRLQEMVPRARSDELIWLTPVLRQAGSAHAWLLKDNALDALDAIREVIKRFRVDGRRVYLAGASMGAGGVASYSWLFPQAFSAYGPVAGYYWNDLFAVPDLSGIHYRVVHGALDTTPYEPFDRLGLAENFVAKCEAAGASVQKVIVPDVGHAYPPAQVDAMNAFFLDRAKEGKTDWETIRAQIAALP